MVDNTRRVVVGPVEELPPGERKIIVPFRGRAGIGVFNVNGAFYALRNLCPHKSGPLCTGRVGPLIVADAPPTVTDANLDLVQEGEIIRCPWHMWEFEIATGRCLVDAKARVKTYPVVVESGQVVVYADPPIYRRTSHRRSIAESYRRPARRRATPRRTWRPCMLTTPLCSLLGIERPILNASMAGTATGRLAAAVSEAGGFGMIGGTNPEGASWLREQIRIARSLTSRPFGVGFISAFPDTAELAQVALDEGVAAINHSFADPTPFVSSTHSAGAKLLVQVQTLKQAIAAAAVGADVIIAQGGEAGGHAGALGTFALLPAVVDAVAPLPVVAAGGIADGRGLAAALLLGAQGVWMGTRFVTSHEWGGPAWEQEAVLAATSDDTVQTRLYDLIAERPFPAENPDRMLRNAFIDRWQGRESEISAHRQELIAEIDAGSDRADPAVAGISAGVAAGLIWSAQPAGDIVRDIVREAEIVLRERPRMLLD